MVPYRRKRRYKSLKSPIRLILILVYSGRTYQFVISFGKWKTKRLQPLGPFNLSPVMIGGPGPNCGASGGAGAHRTVAAGGERIAMGTEGGGSLECATTPVGGIA